MVGGGDTTFAQRTDAISSYRKSTPFVHPKVFANMLGFGSVSELDTFVRQLKKGGTGERRGRAGWISNPGNIQIDVKSPNANELNLHRETFGNKRSPSTEITEPSTEVAEMKIDFYIIKKNERRYAISLKEQMNMIRDITGTASDLSPTLQARRKDQWRSCLLDGDTNNEYYRECLPIIMKDYFKHWETEIDPNEQHIPRPIFNKIFQEIIVVLQCSYVIPWQVGHVSIIPRSSARLAGEDPSAYVGSDEDGSNDDNDEHTPRTSRHQQGDTLSNLTGSASAEVAAVTGSRRNRRNVSRGVNQGSILESIGGDGDSSPVQSKPPEENSFLKSLELKVMRESWDNDSEDYLKVASLEVAAKEAHKEETLPSTEEKPPTRMSIANNKIRQLGGKVLNRDEYNALTSITRGDLGGRIRRFDKLKSGICAGMSSIAKGLTNIKEGQLLLEWVNVHQRIQDGETLPRKLRTKSKSNDQLALTHEVAHIMRHIIICYNVSMTKFVGLTNCFAALLLGRGLEMHEFPSTATVRLWLPALKTIDQYHTDQLDLKTFGFTSKHGFPVLYYLVTDDTVHGKNDKCRHCR